MGLIHVGYMMVLDQVINVGLGHIIVGTRMVMKMSYELDEMR